MAASPTDSPLPESPPVAIRSAEAFAEPEHRGLFWCVAIALGLLQMWAYRFDVVPDGVSYIEIAWSAIHNGRHGFVNGYWSPLYPFLLSVAFRLVRPAPFSESTVVHVVNFGIYLASLAAFEMFLRELIHSRAARASATAATWRVPTATLSMWGYLFVMWCAHSWIPLALVTPDLLVAADVFLATALLLRIGRRPDNWFPYAALGAALAAGYFSKAILFLVAFVFLAGALLVAKSRRRALPRAAVALAVFLGISSPWLAAISSAKHRFTFGDVGADNYAAYVDGANALHWQGGPPGSGMPLHPTRPLLSAPALYEFATPIPGSYPPTYDPSYWHDGVRPHFTWSGQYGALYQGANLYHQMVYRTGVPVTVLLTIIVLIVATRRWTSAAPWPIWLPTSVALALYALVHVIPRLVGGFALMLLFACFASVHLPRAGNARRVALAIITLAPALYLAAAAALDVAALRSPPGNLHLQVARELPGLGLSPGATIGMIGTGAGSYWAHLAGVRIIAEVPD